MAQPAFNGHCPVPFLQETLFPPSGGFIGGRYCETIAGSNISCCLPCPLADWRYDNRLIQKTDVASWISVAILPLCIFLLVSYAVLPVKWTHRHYLSVCFTLGICCMEIAFIIPLGAKPKQCHNAITPNDMHSDLSCAFSGSFLLFGGWMVVMWSFIRTIAFHLQVCWEVVLGKKFMWGAFVCGFGIPALGLTVMLLLTGVSFRFGEICHINVAHGLQDYWIPIMAFATAALILQLTTMAYCIHIYIRSLFDKTTTATNNSSGLPSYAASVRTMTARQAYRRVRRVLQLQWRGVTLVLIIIANVIFFAVAFIDLDRAVEPNAANTQHAKPWLTCLVLSGGDKAQCRNSASAIGPNEATLLAVVILLSLVGFWNFLLFARPSMFAGWLDLYQRAVTRQQESGSTDDQRRFLDHKGFEMLTTSAKTPEPSFVPSPNPAHTPARSPITSPSPSGDRGHLGQEARYVRPSMSFSSPHAPNSGPGGREWDPVATFAPGYAR
ncbi:hypothetical protein NUU61_002416 [Penicillium alfredii]|uniref:G-protein coupled receptors family 2 profile 2 domain-containing protein n=1 Tax=Penicillium alfredii TaxID=1506179 RepID=A0A9W9FRH9_9EURO|nr:uncharacterized protein NUU61_002416 [Penicillium alfredii]KAJ5105069.1 hypothetical protein NUU61_002416 [Penicillium alfredii]